MKKTFFLLTLIIIISGNLISQEKETWQISSNKFKSLSETNKGLIIDVRTHGEYRNGHLKDAQQINFYSFDFKSKLLKLPKDKPLYLYCNTGYRSKLATNILLKSGYTNIYNLEKGIMEWNLLKLPVIVEKDAKKEMKDYYDIAAFNSLLKSNKLVFIDFYATWCAPCKKMMPMIESLQTEYAGKIEIVKINVDASKDLVEALKLVGVPKLYLIKDEKVIFVKEEEISKSDLINIFEQALKL